MLQKCGIYQIDGTIDAKFEKKKKQKHVNQIVCVERASKLGCLVLNGVVYIWIQLKLFKNSIHFYF
jgi:plastocyanin domain-containing protein